MTKSRHCSKSWLGPPNLPSARQSPREAAVGNFFEDYGLWVERNYDWIVNSYFVSLSLLLTFFDRLHYFRAQTSMHKRNRSSDLKNCKWFFYVYSFFANNLSYVRPYTLWLYSFKFAGQIHILMQFNSLKIIQKLMHKYIKHPCAQALHESIRVR
jgi:hypothetical protein